MRSPFLWLAVALHLMLASTYAWTTPHFEGPDENSHYEYAWHLANAGKLPLTPSLQRERGLPQTEAAVLAHHPPLYYALLAAAMVAAGERDVVFGPLPNPRWGDPAAPSGKLHFLHAAHDHALLNWLRMLSVLLGAVTIVCVHGLGRACCPRAPRVADLAAWLVACLPMWSSLHGLLNSDVLAATLAAATTLLLVRTLQSERVGAGRGIALGALLGAALLTKLTTLFLCGLAGLVATIVLRRRRASMLPPAAALLATCAISGWAFWRNLSLYGDPLAMNAHDASFQPLPPEYRWPYLLGLDASLPAFLPELFASLFGRFGWFAVEPHPALLWCGAVIAGFATIGLVRACFDREPTHRPRAGWLLLLACALVLLATAYFNFKVYQPQARLLFPAVAPAAVLLAAGLDRMTAGAPFRRFALLLLPATAALVYFGTFRPALAKGLAPAPVEHRNLVGGIVAPDGPQSIQWRSDVPSEPRTSPPTLRWTDADAPAGTRYTLYAFDADGRIWLATHEWAHDAVRITGDTFAIPAPVWEFLPHGVPLLLRLRRLPTTADERPCELVCSPSLPLTRR
ncbi:MAG TPA: hypothetical protein ENI87_10975 [bacterium]|nr:hypothetical protein [bacterium]